MINVVADNELGYHISLENSLGIITLACFSHRLGNYQFHLFEMKNEKYHLISEKKINARSKMSLPKWKIDNNNMGNGVKYCEGALETNSGFTICGGADARIHFRECKFCKKPVLCSVCVCAKVTFCMNCRGSQTAKM